MTIMVVSKSFMTTSKVFISKDLKCTSYMIQKIVYVLVMLESQSHGSLEVSEAMIVGINEVKGEGPLDRTAASAWSSTYQAELITTNTSQVLERTTIILFPSFHHYSVK